MRIAKKLLGIGALAAVTGLAGCAQGFGMGAGGLVVRSCSAPQTFSTTYRTTNVVAAKQQVAAVHSRFMPGAQYMAKAAGPTVWKRAATGECRRY
jgi:hypothetical protein